MNVNEDLRTARLLDAQHKAVELFAEVERRRLVAPGVCHWILEVHLVDRTRQIGGFHEELLDIVQYTRDGARWSHRLLWH